MGGGSRRVGATRLSAYLSGVTPIEAVGNLLMALASKVYVDRTETLRRGSRGFASQIS